MRHAGNIGGFGRVFRAELVAVAALLAHAVSVGHLAAQSAPPSALRRIKELSPVTSVDRIGPGTGRLVLGSAAEMAAQRTNLRPERVKPRVEGGASELRSYIVVHRERPLVEARAALVSAADGSRPGSSPRRVSAAASRRIAAEVAAQRSRIDAEHARLEQVLGASAGGPAVTARRGATPSGKREVFHTRAVANTSIVTLTPTERQALAAQGFDVREFPPLRTTLVDSVPLVGATRSWSMVDARGRQIRGAGVTVGVIDTGIDYRHPAFGGCSEGEFLAGECTKVAGGYDFVNNTPNPLDDGIHGTHVAATVAGLGTPGPGVAPDAILYALKVCGGDGWCGYSEIVRALEWAADPDGNGDTSDHLDIVNLSLGGHGHADDLLSVAVDNASAAGVVVVVAAGNSGPYEGSIGTPGAARSAITVAASTARGGAAGGAVDQLADFSSRGPASDGIGEPILKPDLAAPGVDICAAAALNGSGNDLTSCADGLGISMSGTSMAAPHVAGAAALLLQAHPSWSPRQIKLALVGTAQPMRESSTGRAYEAGEVGAGRLDVLAALELPGLPEEQPRVALFGRRVIGVESATVRGSVSGRTLERWILEARFPGSSVWQPIADGVDEVTAGVLGSVDLSDVPTGTVSLRLSAEYADRTLTTEGRLIYASIEVREVSQSDQYYFFAYPPPSERIELWGSIGGGGFERYELTLCHPTANGRVCSGDGVTAVNDGTTPVTNGVLGHLTPAEIPFTGDVDIIVSLHRRGLPVEVATIPYFKLPADGVERLADSAASLYTNAIVADLGDGAGQRLIALSLNQIECLHLPSREQCAGFPVPAPRGSESLLTRLHLRDLDQDGTLEIVAIDEGDWEGETWVVVVRAGGTVMFDAALPGGRTVLIHQLRFGDLDRDGVEEIIYLDYEDTYHLHALRLGGGEAPGFPRVLDQPSLLYGNQVSSPVTIADLDRDSIPEIVVVGVIPRVADPQDSFDYDTRVHLLSADGEIRAGFPVTLPGNTFDQGALVGNLGPAGAPAIVLATSDRENHLIHALSVSGEPVRGFPARTSASIHDFNWLNLGLLSLADLTDDGIPEIIDATQLAISIYDPAAQEFLSGWEQREVGGDFLAPSGQVLVTNLDDDREPELLFTSNLALQGYRPAEAWAWGVKALNLDGSVVGGFPRVMPLSWGSHTPSVLVDSATGSQKLLVPAYNAVYALSLGGCAGTEPLWARSGGDVSSSNVAVNQALGWGNACPEEVMEPPSILLAPNSYELTDEVGGVRSLLALPRSRGAVSTRWQARFDDETEWRDLPGFEGLPHITPAPVFGTLYRLVASNAVGTTVSEEARIGFPNYPVITRWSADQVVEPGATVRLEVEARCNQPLTFKWTGQRDGSSQMELLPERTTSAFEQSFITPGEYQFYAEVSCAGFTDASPIITITVQDREVPPTPTIAPTATPTPTPRATATPVSGWAPTVAATWRPESRRLEVKLTGLRRRGCAVSLYLTSPGREAELRRVRVTAKRLRRGRILLAGRVGFGGNFSLAADQVCQGERSARSAEVRVRLPRSDTIGASQLRRQMIKAVRRFRIG